MAFEGREHVRRRQVPGPGDDPSKMTAKAARLRPDLPAAAKAHLGLLGLLGLLGD